MVGVDVAWVEGDVRDDADFVRALGAQGVTGFKVRVERAAADEVLVQPPGPPAGAARDGAGRCTGWSTALDGGVARREIGCAVGKTATASA